MSHIVAKLIKRLEYLIRIVIHFYWKNIKIRHRVLSFLLKSLCSP